jgi:hypothetical protein
MPKDKWFVVAMISAFAIAGLVEPHMRDPGQPFNAVGVVQALVFLVLLRGWCIAHAKANAIKPPAGAALLVAFIAVIGLPYYAFRAYGLRRGFLLLLSSIGVLAVMLLVYVGCYTISAMVGA